MNDEGTSDWSDARTHDTVANSPPVFTEGPTATRELAENSPVGTNVGTTLAATDSDADMIKYLIAGANAGNFTIDQTTGQVKGGPTRLRPRNQEHIRLDGAGDGLPRRQRHHHRHHRRHRRERTTGSP